jgi:hypothetical protein
VSSKENQLCRVAKDVQEAGQRQRRVEIEENPASGTKNTDEPNPATVPTISEKNAIKKNRKTNMEYRCRTLS